MGAKSFPFIFPRAKPWCVQGCILPITPAELSCSQYLSAVHGDVCVTSAQAVCAIWGSVCAHCLWRLAYLAAGTCWSAAGVAWWAGGSWRWGVLWGSWVGLVLESASQSVASVAGFWDTCSSCLDPLSICSSPIFLQTIQPCWSSQWYEWGEGEGEVYNILQGWETIHSFCSYLLPWEKLLAEGGLSWH